MDINQVFGGDSLKAADLQGREVTVTIASCEVKKFDNGDRLVIRFAGKKKALICNKTNAKRIALLHGTETAAWIGKQIGLHAEMVDFKGEAQMAVRVKAPTAPTAPAQPVPFTQAAHQPADDFDDPIADTF